jgi:hypothetical protein
MARVAMDRELKRVEKLACAWVLGLWWDMKGQT